MWEMWTQSWKEMPSIWNEMRKCKRYNHWEQVCRSKQTQDRQTGLLSQTQFNGRQYQDKSRQSKVHIVRKQDLTLRSCYLRPLQLMVRVLVLK